MVGAGLSMGVLAGGVTVGAGDADAAPRITCKGSICTNKGNDWGIGHGTFRCPNGIKYPSIAIVPPRSKAAVFPAYCQGPPNLYPVI